MSDTTAQILTLLIGGPALAYWIKQVSATPGGPKRIVPIMAIIVTAGCVAIAAAGLAGLR